MRITIIFIFQLGVFCLLSAQGRVRPAANQLEWQEKEYYLFVHFGPNTFSGVEWGTGDESNDIFAPSDLDCNQWCTIAKNAGAKGIIITAKHHDGFCLWPSTFSVHTVAQSAWKQGQGDVLRDLSKACKTHGLDFGVYISPWDRNHPKYGTDEYNNVFLGMMWEIFENYGPISELWWDGANGEGFNGRKQVYDWEGYKNFVRQKSPHTLIFSDVGPDIRWVGNENGVAATTNWNFLNTDGYSAGLNAPPADTLAKGNVYGKYWIPAECDVSIRPGWFYHKSEDNKVKSASDLFDIYLKSVGRGANLLLNVPPDMTGHIYYQDSVSLIEFKRLLDNNFNLDVWADANTLIRHRQNVRKTKKLTDNKKDTSERLMNGDHIIVDLITKSMTTNCIVLEEDLRYGQSVDGFEIFGFDDNEKQVIYLSGTTIGHKRIFTFPATTLKKCTISIKNSKSEVYIRDIHAYKLDESLIKN